MRRNMNIGYVLATIGLFLICWNGYLFIKFSIVSWLFLTLSIAVYAAGAFMVMRYKD